MGQAAAAALKEHRAAVAGRLGCAPEELVFTSCGTEGDNWAVRAAADYGRRKGRHIITTAIEHAAVLEPVKALAAQGYEVTYLKPDRSGHVSPDALRAALRPDTVLVSMMLVNNELGTLLPVAEAAQAIRDAGSPALLHCDAVQAFLKVPFTPAELGVDLLTLSGHKIRAPKGIGVQYIRRGLNLKPLLTGGGQEGGLRPGTEPTAQAAALAAACAAWQEDYPARIQGIKEYALESLSAVPGLEIISRGTPPHLRRLPARLPQRNAGAGAVRPGVYVSSGSACHRGKPSHVFAALGLPKRTLMGVLRVSFSPESTRADVDALAGGLTEIAKTRIAAR
ncbi:MAG: cysteine desulfurase family protein [Flavonifractor plautii]